MGMLVDGVWRAEEDRFMQDGAFRREASPLPDTPAEELAAQLAEQPEHCVLVASNSCPWSHGAVLARQLTGFSDCVAMQWAGGPRIEGYMMMPGGPLNPEVPPLALHRLYTATVPDYTGRSTVPVLWDEQAKRIVSNSSATIIRAFSLASEDVDLSPAVLRSEIEELIERIFDGLSNAVYRAGKAQRQDEYEEAVDSVFATLGDLETRLADRTYLFGDRLTEADIRLFATLVRFDTVYATHFRCTRHRLTDYENLWRYTRRIFQRPGVAETVDFDEIRRGYYLNDGDHNPHGLVAEQPVIDWFERTGL